MLTQVEARTSRVTVPPLPFNASGVEATDLLQIRNIDGLGPVAATINTSQYGSVDDEFYNGSFTGKRNIVLTIGFNPDWANYTFETLRQIVYEYFMPKNDITLLFTSTHMEPVTIDGFVETCEPNIFSKAPEMLVSIICPKAAFIAASASVVPGVTLALPDGAPTIIDYKGSLPTGFVLDIHPVVGIANLNGEVKLINQSPLVSLFDFQGQVTATTGIQVSTVTGDKYLRETILGTDDYVNNLGAILPGSVWMPLLKGINKFRVMTATPGQTWALQYFARYGGI